MISLFERFDDPYIYGPLSDEEMATIRVSHRTVKLDDGWYIGVGEEIPEWQDRFIPRPNN